jgi:hypothetical protein
VHPNGSSVVVQRVIQNQSAKTALYLAVFAVILPVALFAVPRLAATIAAGPNAPALPVLAALLTATFAAALIVVRAFGALGLGDGLGVLLGAALIWSGVAAAALTRAARPRPWTRLLKLESRLGEVSAAAGLLVLGTVLCATHLRSLSAVGLALGAAVMAGVLVAHDRLRLPRLGRWPGAGIDLAIVVILLLAVPDVVIFRTSSALPNIYFPPGIIQVQQDWLLGPTNQLLAGGALLVNVPVSQYGVGLIYFLDAWFHLAPIGYGSFGLLDGILTALFYVAGYGVLRLAGSTRLLAGSVLAFAVAVFIYNLHFPVGALPEQGPLRFGMPIAVVLALVAASRWPRRARAARAGALVVVGVASIWAFEAFAYTLFTFGAVAVLEAWLRPPGSRLRWLVREALLVVAACASAQLILAAATLASTGELPHWGQYLAYLRGLLLGGQEGLITFGFENWSPGLFVAAACLASAAGIALLVRKAPPTGRQDRARVIALTGITAYAIAVFSYTDNRSATYLLLYTSLPILLAGALWLGLLLEPGRALPRRVRLGGLAFALSVVVLMLAAAWPAVGSHFSDSALAHADPGGGLRTALHRLWHPPPIDPRAPAGERVLDRFMPGKRALILLPTAPDLAIEILMRSKRASSLFVGDPREDVFVPSDWVPKLTREIAALPPGERLLTDQAGLRIAAELGGHRAGDLIEHPVGGGSGQLEWILQRIDERFRLRPVYADGPGFVVAELVPRS